MVLDLIARVARPDGQAGPLVRAEDQLVPIRQWLASALAPSGARHPQRRAAAETIRDALAASGRLPADPQAAQREIEAQMDERVCRSGMTAMSRAVSERVRAGPRPVPLPEQEWLLNGRRVDRVVAVRDGEVARMVVPDPRWFALQKLWMAEKPGRDPQKKPKDRRQGTALLDAVWLTMRHYALDDAFYAELPDELKPNVEHWNARKPPRS